MTEQICKCHCGTRIDLDEELLQQREMWKQKYLCLQKQIKVDIQTMKQNIYAQCSNLMQLQFSTRQANHNKIVNQKNIEIKDLISKIINLETKVKILEKQRQMAQYKIKQNEADIQMNETQIKRLRNQRAKAQREWEIKYQEGICGTRKKLANNAKDQIQKIQSQRQHLRHKVKQFELKYQKIIPQVQKMKNALQAKNIQIVNNQNAFDKIRKELQQKIQLLKEEKQDIHKKYTLCAKHIKNSENKNEQLQAQLEKLRKINRQVRVQPVYIDRPVQVEKVVEKVIEVEKVVKKFIDNPNNSRLTELQQENKKLRNQLNHILSQIKQMQEHYTKNIADLEDNIKIHEDNTIKYKKQRQNLAYKISQQNKQISMLQQFIQRFGSQKNTNSHESQKIVVHVKKDGTYDKKIQKIPSNTHIKRKK